MMSNGKDRNDPCFCGSRKKYKKCCLLNADSDSNAEILDLAWHQLRETEGRVIEDHLLPYVSESLPQEVVIIASQFFFPENLPESMDEEIIFTRFFLPWFLFNWIPFDDFDLVSFEPQKSIALNYLAQYASRLSSAEKQFIEGMSKTHYSFYSVLEIEFEKSLLVKDILLGTVHRLKEYQGTHGLKRSDILFGRILTLNDQSIFIGLAPYIIPVRYQNTLIAFRKWLIEENDDDPLNASVLHDELEMELFNYFFEIMEWAYKKPTLMNTDDERIQFSKSYFKLGITPEEAFKHLFPLTLSKNPEKFLHEAERDLSGEVKRIQFSWLKKNNKKRKNSDHTVMGEITIESGRLILETNSQERTERGKKLLNQYLEKAVHFQQTLIESPEQKLKSFPRLDNEDTMPPEILDSPEIQEKLKFMIKQHWENWFDSPIPALGDKTPREAAKTEEGREALEALLLQYERHALDFGDRNLFKADIPYLRSQLGLEETLAGLLRE